LRKKKSTQDLIAEMDNIYLVFRINISKIKSPFRKEMGFENLQILGKCKSIN
jgi:hypothetical protein